MNTIEVRLMSTRAIDAHQGAVSRRRPIVRPGRYKINKSWVRYGLAVAVYGILFAIWQVQPIPLYVHAAGVLVAAICMFPMALWAVKGSVGVPMFEVICIAYLLQFDNPIYLQPNSLVVNSQVSPFTWDQTFQTLLLVGLGMVCMIGAYYGTKRTGISRRLGHVNLPLTSQGRARYIVVAIVFGLGVTLLQSGGLGVNSASGLAAIVRLLASQFTIAIVLLAYRVYRREVTGAKWVYLLYGAVIIAVALGLESTFLEVALAPLVLLFLIRWHVRRKLPLLVLALGLTGFVVLQSIKAEYRQRVAAGGVTGTGLITSWFDQAGGVVQNTLTGDVVTNSQNLFRQSMQRFDTFHVFERVYTLTPSTIPFYGGSTYEYFLYGWVPRAVWADKPVAQASDKQLAIDYGLQAPAQTLTTSIGLGHITEAYANFGILGVAIILAIQGAFLSLYNDILNGPESEGGRAIYLSIMVFFLNGIGGSTTDIFGPVIQNTVGSALILRLFAFRGRATRTKTDRGSARLPTIAPGEARDPGRT